MHRFFVPPEWLKGERISLGGPLAHQLSRVLRLQAGEHVTLLDDSGWAYEVALDRVSPQEATAHLVSRTQPQTEPRVRLVLYQALTKETKFDWVLQKGTELGVSTFVPLVTERCLIGSPESLGEQKMRRWQRIVTEAAEQSGRARLPRVSGVMRLAEACEPAPAGVLALIAWVSPQAMPLAQVMRQAASTSLEEIRFFVGPEGDFSPAEVERARQAGILPISLGLRVLRTETAGLVALAAINYALGEMG
jgi:16S rRNA (uracil1498-N3)-methyltransferase